MPGPETLRRTIEAAHAATLPSFLVYLRRSLDLGYPIDEIPEENPLPEGA